MINDKTIRTIPAKRALNNIAFVFLMSYVILLHIGNDMFSVFMNIIFASAFMLAVVSATTKFCIPSLIVPLLTLVVYAFITTLWAEDRSTAMSSNLTMLWCVLLAWLIAILCNTKKRINSILIAFVIGCIVLDLYCYVKFGFSIIFMTTDDAERLGGDTLNANMIGAANAFAVIIVFYLVLEYKKILLYLLAIPSILFTLLSASRTSVIVLLLGLLLMIILPKRKHKAIKIIVLLAIVIGIIIFLYNIGFLTNIIDRFNTSVNVISSSSKGVGSTQIRLQCIKLGLQYFVQNPIFGYGTAQFNLMTLKEMGTAWMPHNAYIQSMYAYGIIGLILWQGTYIREFICLMKFKRNNLAITCIVIIILRLISDLASNSMTSKETYIFVGLIIATISYLRSEKTLEGNEFKSDIKPLQEKEI